MQTWIWGVTGCPVDLFLCATGAGAQSKLVKSFFGGGYVIWSIWSTKQKQPLYFNRWKGLRAKKRGLLCCFSLGCNWSANAGVEQQCPGGSPARIWTAAPYLNQHQYSSSAFLCISFGLWLLSAFFTIFSAWFLFELSTAKLHCAVQGPLTRAAWIKLSLCHRQLLSFSLLFSEQWALIAIKLSGTWCELKYGIHSISAWNDGMIFKCCLFLLWDIADLEIRLEIAFIYYNYYWSISFGWHPNKNFFIVKQSVDVEACLYSKGSACRHRWTEQLIYFKLDLGKADSLLSAKYAKLYLDSKASVVVLVSLARGWKELVTVSASALILPGKGGSVTRRMSEKFPVRLPIYRESKVSKLLSPFPARSLNKVLFTPAELRQEGEYSVTLRPRLHLQHCGRATDGALQPGDRHSNSPRNTGFNFQRKTCLCLYFPFSLHHEKKNESRSSPHLHSVCWIIRESAEGALPHDCIERVQIKYPVLNYF